ncbi:MAG: carboxypeptidase regulatory-like domain-containing protein [Candidatus Caldatribacteriaceae bacterium]
MSSSLRGVRTHLFLLGMIGLFLLGGCFLGNAPRLPVVSALVGLRGAVVDVQTGKGVAGAQIVVRDYPDRSDLTASDGSFFIPRVPAGRQVLLVSASGYASKSEAVNIPEGEVFAVTISLSPFLGKITGFVWDGDGKPVAGATVTVDGRYTTTTKANGNFALSGIPVGKFALTVEKDGFVPYSGEVTVQASSVTVVNVVLKSPAP